MPTYEFDLRFRELQEAEGCGSLGVRLSSSGRSLVTAIHNAMDKMTQQHPDAVFDHMIFYGHPD